MPGWTPYNPGVLSEWLYNIIDPASKTADWFALILLVAQALILNNIVAANKMTRSITLFPGVFYILVGSIVPEFNHLSPILLANTFLLIAVREFLRCVNIYAPSTLIFNYGFWLGIGSLFYYPYAIFIFLGFMGILTLRNPKVTEFLMIVSGFIVPYLFVGTYFYWTDQLDKFWTEITAGFGINGLSITLDYELIGLSTFGILFLLLLFFKNSSLYLRLRNIERKKLDFIYWAFLISIIIFTLQPAFHHQNIFVFVFPVGALLAFHFATMKNTWAELLHLILYLSIIAYQIGTSHATSLL